MTKDLITELDDILFDLAFAVGGLGEDPLEPLKKAKQDIITLIEKDIIGEDVEAEMYDIKTGEYRSAKQLDRNRIGAFQNLTRYEQRERLNKLLGGSNE